MSRSRIGHRRNRRSSAATPATLQRVAEFNEDFLHLGGAPEEVRDYFNRLEREQSRDNRG